MGILLREPGFVRALADVDRAGDRLRHDRDHVDRQVGALLDGGWSGAAATAFGEGWDDWLGHARDVLDGLAAMGELLRAARAGLVDGDEGAAERLSLVSARVLDRLGP